MKDTNTLREECEHLNTRMPIICNDCNKTLKNAPLQYPIKEEFNQKLEEIEREIEEMINSEIKFDEMKSEFLSSISKASLKLALQIIKNKKNVSSLNPKETDGSQKCTCKDFKINNKCYWHGK